MQRLEQKKRDLDQIRLSVLKKWTWINGRLDLPEAHTLFYLYFVIALQPVDDFLCLGELTLRRSLDIMSVIKGPQKPDIRSRKSLEDATPLVTINANGFGTC